MSVGYVLAADRPWTFRSELIRGKRGITAVRLAPNCQNRNRLPNHSTRRPFTASCLAMFRASKDVHALIAIDDRHVGKARGGALPTEHTVADEPDADDARRRVALDRRLVVREHVARVAGPLA